MFWRILHLVSFPHGSSIAKLAQVHGLRKIVRIRLEVLDFAHPPPCGRHLPKIGIARSTPFGGRKSSTPETSKAQKAGPEDPKRSGSLNGPRSLWNGFKDSGRNSRFFEGKAYRPPQERGFHRLFLHRGENPQIPQDPGSPQRGRETEEGFCYKKPTGESKTPSHEKT